MIFFPQHLSGVCYVYMKDFEKVKIFIINDVLSVELCDL